MAKQKTPTVELIRQRYEKCYDFNRQIGLYENVEVNENFFIGNQWEGVVANGLPTPVFNFLKQVVLFQVATISSDNMKLQATAMPCGGSLTERELEKIALIVTKEFSAIMEREKIASKCREYLRDAAVDGDGCIHFYFDPTVKNGQSVTGEICSEVLQNTRVHFGNPNSRNVQDQPYILISRREIADDVQYRAEQLRKEGLNKIDDPETIQPDSEKFKNTFDSYTDDKVTVLTYYYKNRETGTIWCAEATETAMIRDPYDTEYTLYPLVWLNWDYRHDCYHGQAMISGLIPNQKFINKIFAMAAVSMITQSFPKIIYDQTRIKNWSGGIGEAVGVNGNIADVAKVMEGAPINPQIAQFMELCIQKTRTFLGASDVAMGDSRPDNTSAIIALQRAANTPMELTKQNHYQCVEDMGRIFMDMMAAKYGVRKVETEMELDEPGMQPLGMQLQGETFLVDFDFSILREVRFAIKQDVGASSYWSEMATMQTMDNLLMNHLITPQQYIERLPSGYITGKQKLLDELKASAGAAPAAPAGTGISPETISSTEIPVEANAGNGSLQRALNREGV